MNEEKLTRDEALIACAVRASNYNPWDRCVVHAKKALEQMSSRPAIRAALSREDGARNKTATEVMVEDDDLRSHVAALEAKLRDMITRSKRNDIVRVINYEPNAAEARCAALERERDTEALSFKAMQREHDREYERAQKLETELADANATIDGYRNEPSYRELRAKLASAEQERDALKLELDTLIDDRELATQVIERLTLNLNAFNEFFGKWKIAAPAAKGTT